MSHSPFRNLRPHPRVIAALATLALVGLPLAGCSASSQADSSTGADASTGDQSSPTVSALSATTGSLSGGTSITLTGTALDQVTAVNFGETAVPVTATSSTELTVTTPAAVDFAAGEVEVTLSSAASASSIASGSTFSYESLTALDAQMSYVLAHWDDRNVEEYGSLDNNDCVNFASQSLIERGWVQTASWSHSVTSAGTHDYSSAWISSTSMMKYLAQHAELATALTDDERDQVVVGDLVQFDWDNSGDRDHTGIVTRVEGEGADRVISFAGHSLDSDYRSVDDAITVDHPGGTAYYWHLEA